MTLRRVDQQRSTSQYCGEDGVEFSLPEGVDLVGIDSNSTLRKPSSSYHHQHHPHHIQHSSAGNTPLHQPKLPKWKSAIKLILINIFVCSLVLGYALIGSFVFLALEGQTKGPVSGVKVSASGYSIRKSNLTLALWNSLQGDEIQQLKNDTVRNIWDITLSMNILYQDNWTRLTADEIGTFQRTFIEKVLQVVETSNSHEVPYVWTFPRAFLFALTTLTTIGYGGIGPKTSSAKIATMIYAIFGIPIMLWYLSNVGSLLAKIARFLCAKLCCCCCYEDPPPPRKRQPQSSTSNSSSNRKVSDPYYQIKPGDGDGGGGGLGVVQSYGDAALSRRDDPEEGARSHPRVSILFVMVLSIGVLLGYICLGSYIVSRWEKWHFLDGFYFCFLTLTTISFGDIRAPKTGGLERFTTRTEWFCSFYILFGMALTSMFFNILHEEISRKYQLWKDLPVSRGMVQESKESLATVNRTRRRPLENSYSVHFMNFNSPSNTTDSRNFTEETILSNEVHCKPRGLPCSDSTSKMYDEEEVPTDYIVAHPIPPPREIYGSHPVFPRNCWRK